MVAARRGGHVELSEQIKWLKEELRRAEQEAADRRYSELLAEEVRVLT